MVAPPIVVEPEVVALPAVGFEAPPAMFRRGTNTALALNASGPMPAQADVVVVAWSITEQRMVDTFAHTLEEDAWLISAEKLAMLPDGEAEVQLLIRQDNQVKAIVSHRLRIERAPVIDPPTTPEPDTVERPAVQFGDTPANYTLGSGQAISLSATGAFPEDGDLLVIAWSSVQSRLVDAFAFTMTEGPLVIPASQMDLLPEGEVVLQLLPREDGEVYSQVTHTLRIHRSSIGGEGTTDGGDTGGGTDSGSEGEPDGGPDGGEGTDPEPETFGVAFASSATNVFQRGSGVTLPLSVSADLPAGSTITTTRSTTPCNAAVMR